MQEIDIWRSANLLLQQHGPVAYVVAAKRLAELQAAGDCDGVSVWTRIIKALDALVAGGIGHQAKPTEAVP